MVLAHVNYLLYLLDFIVPWPFWELTALCVGLWMHLFVFSAGWECGKAVRDALKVVCISDELSYPSILVQRFSVGRHILDALYRIPLVERLATDSQLQVKA